MQNLLIVSTDISELVQALDDSRVRRGIRSTCAVLERHARRRRPRGAARFGPDALPVDLRPWYEWVAASKGNWCWMLELFRQHLREYAYRTGSEHSLRSYLWEFAKIVPPLGALAPWPVDISTHRAILIEEWRTDIESGLTLRWSARGQPDWYNKVLARRIDK